jgi:zinc and cadmium transporter
MLPWIIGFSLLGSVGAVIGAALVLLLKDDTRKVLVRLLISYATGTLLGAAFLGMIPNALKQAPVDIIALTILIGIVGFFVLEKLILWHHCHESDCEIHGRPAPLILIGDAFHNFTDGTLIAAAFLTSMPLGITASLAVIAHELPQEIGDFAILLESGYSRGKAISLNGLSSIATLPGALVAYYFLGAALEAVPYFLAISAASFLYIAMADLIPLLHRQVSLLSSFRQIALLLAGIGTIAMFHHGG